MSCFIKRILQFKEAIPFSYIYITDSSGIEQNRNCEYSWSVDGVCWSGWVSYSDYLRIVKNLETDYYLRVLIGFEIGQVKVNDLLTNCYSLTIDSTNSFLNNFCEDPNLFNPYTNLDCALQLQQQLSDSIICMLGIPIYYFRVTPQEDTADYTFKEYVLHNVESVKQIKLMIPDGQMPSSNYKLTDFDFDWETDWETEISKTQFANAFGDTAFPKNRDFIYIPMMKRMWSVNSAYDEKNEGLMWQSTTWKLSLVKYSDDTNVGVEGFESLIDDWAGHTYEKEFGELERNEQERQVGATPLSSPNYAANNLYDVFMGDSVRAKIANDFNIFDKIICHNNIIVSRNMYNLNKNSIITYQKGMCGVEGSLSFIFNTSVIIEEKSPILKLGDICIYIYKENNNICIQNCNFDKITLQPNTTYLYICKWNKDLYIVHQELYKHTCTKDIPEYLKRPEMFHFEQADKINDQEITEEFISNKKLICSLHGPIQISNIKYFNRYLNDKEIIGESLKYITQDDRCVINDLARPLSVGQGYSVK